MCFKAEVTGSIVVSDFIDEVGGFVRENAMHEFHWGKMVNDHLTKTSRKDHKYFERIYPEVQGLFLFDNAPLHCKIPDNVQNADKMNAGHGEKQPVMVDTIWEGHVQMTREFTRV